MDTLFIAIFEDNTIFKGGDYQTTKWMEIDKPICSLFYTLPLGDAIYLTGYDTYYHFIEVTKDIYMGNQGKINLEFAYLIAKKDKGNKVYKINLKTGQIDITFLPDSDNFIKKLNPDGWKKGI